MLDEFRRLALFTSGVAELTRHRAEGVVREWVKAGDVRREQTSSMVRLLVDTSRENRNELTRLIRREIQNQVLALGLASSRDVQRLERKVERLEAQLKKKAARPTSAKKSTGTTKKPRPSARTSSSS